MDLATPLAANTDFHELLLADCPTAVAVLEAARLSQSALEFVQKKPFQKLLIAQPRLAAKLLAVVQGVGPAAPAAVSASSSSAASAVATTASGVNRHGPLQSKEGHEIRRQLELAAKATTHEERQRLFTAAHKEAQASGLGKELEQFLQEQQQEQVRKAQERLAREKEVQSDNSQQQQQQSQNNNASTQQNQPRANQPQQQRPPVSKAAAAASAPAASSAPAAASSAVANAPSIHQLPREKCKVCHSIRILENIYHAGLKKSIDSVTLCLCSPDCCPGNPTAFSTGAAVEPPIIPPHTTCVVVNTGQKKAGGAAFNAKAAAWIQSCPTVRTVCVVRSGIQLAALPQLPQISRLFFMNGGASLSLGLTDADADRVAATFPNLQEFSASWSCTDGVLAAISKCTSLRALNVSWTHQLSENGFQHLRNFPLMQELDLHSSGLTDASIQHISGLKDLQTLRIGYNPDLTDAALMVVGSLTNLQVLDLRELPLIDSGLQHLRGLQRLEWLSLWRCDQVTDPSLKYVGELKSLVALKIKFCEGITDAGLRHLRELKQLRDLHVLGCEDISDDAVSALKRAIPGLRTDEIFLCS